MGSSQNKFGSTFGEHAASTHEANQAAAGDRSGKTRRYLAESHGIEFCTEEGTFGLRVHAHGDQKHQEAKRSGVSVLVSWASRDYGVYCSILRRQNRSSR